MAGRGMSRGRGILLKPDSNPTDRLAAFRDPFGAAPPGYIPGRGRGATGFAGGVSRDDSNTALVTDTDRADYSDANYDEFTGYASGALFRDGLYDEEDRQADEVYEKVDLRMDERRKTRREERFKAEVARLRSEKPTLSQQFSDLKRGLQSLSSEDWGGIAEIGDYSLRKKRAQRAYQTDIAAPDSLLLRARTLTQNSTSIEAGLVTPLVGTATPAAFRLPGTATVPNLLTGSNSTPAKSTTTSLNELGEARGTVLLVKLDRMMDSVSGQTVIDPKGYLTNLNALSSASEADIADIKKARLLLKSVTQTNPRHVPGWVAAARLEEIAGRIEQARSLIAQGCVSCPKSEEIWLEAARLAQPEEAAATVANGLKNIPHSVKLWQEAAQREPNLKLKKAVYRKALQFVPNSVRLWKDTVALEPPETAKVFLRRAVQCIPSSVELWITLAKLSPYAEAQKVLNEARKKIPISADVWLAAAMLEEQQGHLQMAEKIVRRCLQDLSHRGVSLERDEWISKAENAEKTAYPAVAAAIIAATLDLGVEAVNRRRLWASDVETLLAHGSVLCARTLLREALKQISSSEPLWHTLIELEREHGNKESLEKVLVDATTACPSAEALWLTAAKLRLLHNDVEGARSTLADAFNRLGDKEKVSLEAVKLELSVNEFQRARVLLDQTRVRCHMSWRVWMQAIQLERMLGNTAQGKVLCDEAVQKHPDVAKLWMIAGHLRMESEPAEIEEALRMFDEGRKKCPKSVELWLCAVDVLRSQKLWNRARALLDAARRVNPKQDQLWLAAVHVELEAAEAEKTQFGHNRDFTAGANNLIVGVNPFSANPPVPAAQHVMARALNECPHSGLLWSEAIFLEPSANRNSRSVDALSACENDPAVILAIGKLFWAIKKNIKARRWLTRATVVNPKFGDAWAYLLRFEIEAGTSTEQKSVLVQCVEAEPNQGLVWNRIVKQPKHWRETWAQKLRAVVEGLFPGTLPENPESDFALKNLDRDVFEVLYGRGDIAKFRHIVRTEKLKKEKEEVLKPETPLPK